MKVGKETLTAILGLGIVLVSKSIDTIMTGLQASINVNAWLTGINPP